jgi:hypothetical protein
MSEMQFGSSRRSDVSDHSIESLISTCIAGYDIFLAKGRVQPIFLSDGRLQQV